MLKILIFSFLVTFLYTPYGFLFQKGTNLRSYSLQLIFGLIVLSFLALLLNFFTPLSQIVNSFFLLLSIFILIKFKRSYLNKKYFIFCILSSFIVFLLITKSNVYRPDAGLYHLPYINILNQEKIILGISNLHFRFGHISIIQYLSAISNNLLFRENGIVFSSALIASAVIINLISYLNKNIKSKNYDFHFLLTFSFLIFIFYKVNRYSEYGNDAPAHLLMFILVSEIIKNFNNIKMDNVSNYFLLSIFIIMNKIILLISIIFPFALFLNKNLKINYFNKKNFFIIFFFLLWCVKNILTSGCLLYPVKNTCFNNLVWTNDIKAQKVSIQNEAWAKGWPDYKKKNNGISQLDYSKKFFWLNTWANNHFIKILKIMIPYLIFLFVLLLIVRSNNKKNKSKKYINFLIIISLIGSILWFLKVPVFRYGYSYFIILISLFFAFLGSYINFRKSSEKIFKFIICSLLFVFIFKNLNRVIIEDKKYFNYPWPKFYSYDNNNKINKVNSKIIDGKKLYFSIDEYCMYSYAPCGNYNKRLKIIMLKNYFIMYILSE